MEENINYELNMIQLKNKIKYIKNNKLSLNIKMNLHPCSGKTFFHNNVRGFYNGIFIIDIDKYLFSNIRRSRKSLLLKKSILHTCLLGYYEDPVKNDNIIDISIIISFGQLKSNFKSRLNNKLHGFNNFDDIIKSRKRLITQSKLFKIPIFKNILEALNYIIKVWNNKI